MALRLLTLTTIVAGAVTSIDFNSDDFNCPDGWSINTIKDDVWCCFGSGHINNDDGYCCISKFSSGGKIDPDDEINSDCFPFCDGGKKRAEPRKRADDDSMCAEKIPFSASDYSERVSAASKSVMSDSSATNSDSPATTTAEPTNSADESATTTGGSSDEASETGDSDSAEETETNSDNAVGPLPTGALMAKIGGAMAAAALFAL